MAHYELIELQVHAGIATLTLNRPDKRNAFTDGMRADFIHALEHMARDKDVFILGEEVREAGARRRRNRPCAPLEKKNTPGAR